MPLVLIGFEISPEDSLILEEMKKRGVETILIEKLPVDLYKLPPMDSALSKYVVKNKAEEFFKEIQAEKQTPYFELEDKKKNEPFYAGILKKKKLK